MSGVKTTKRGAEPHKITMRGRAGKLQSTFFAAIHGDTHLRGRTDAIQRLANLHGDRPSAFSVDFTAAAWNRAVSDYNES